MYLYKYIYHIHRDHTYYVHLFGLYIYAMYKPKYTADAQEDDLTPTLADEKIPNANQDANIKIAPLEADFEFQTGQVCSNIASIVLIPQYVLWTCLKCALI